MRALVEPAHTVQAANEHWEKLIATVEAGKASTGDVTVLLGWVAVQRGRLDEQAHLITNIEVASAKRTLDRAERCFRSYLERS